MDSSNRGQNELGAMTEDGQRVIVSGSRSIADACGDGPSERLVRAAVDAAPFTPTEIVSGTASGVDAIGEAYADEHDIDVERFPADWDTLGDMAGPKRNSEMAAYADAAVVIRVDGSGGSSDMIRKARRHLGDDSVFVVDIQTPDGE